MKKLTLIFGLISCTVFFLGAFFKILHWPGAGILLTLSIALFALGYSPLLMIDRNKLTGSPYQKFVNTAVMAVMVVIAFSFLFKAMHWPGAGIVIGAGIFLLAALIPVLFIHASKESEPVKKLNFYNEAIILVMIAVIELFVWFR